MAAHLAYLLEHKWEISTTSFLRFERQSNLVSGSESRPLSSARLAMIQLSRGTSVKASTTKAVDRFALYRPYSLGSLLNGHMSAGAVLYSRGANFPAFLW